MIGSANQNTHLHPRRKVQLECRCAKRVSRVGPRSSAVGVVRSHAHLNNLIPFHEERPFE